MTQSKEEISITVGIPAYNEGANIKNLLLSLISQKEDGFVIEKIIVVSDGSSDNTIEQVLSVRDPRIEVLSDRNRVGKVARLNQLFSMVTSDYLVNIDADIKLPDNDVIFHLLEPLRQNLNTDLISGIHHPVVPATFIEKLAYFGVSIWDEAIKILGSKAEFYFATGQVRVFSKRFLKTFRYPPTIFSSEDAFVFMSAKENGFVTAVAERGVVYFKLASTLKDYKHQMVRFLKTKKVIRQNISEETIRKYQTMTLGIKLRALFNMVFKTSPVISISYLFLQLYCKLHVPFHKHVSRWVIANTSKKI